MNPLNAFNSAVSRVRRRVVDSYRKFDSKPNSYFEAISRVWKIVLQVLNPCAKVNGKLQLTVFAKIVLIQHLTMILFITAYVRKSFSALESSEIFELCAILLCMVRNLFYQMFLTFWRSELEEMVTRLLLGRQPTRMFLEQSPLSLRCCKREFLAFAALNLIIAVILVPTFMSVLFFQVNRNRSILNFQILFLPYDGISLNWFVTYLYQMSVIAFQGAYICMYSMASLMLLNHTCWKLDDVILEVKQLQSTTKDHDRDRTLDVISVSKQLTNVVIKSLRSMEWIDRLQNMFELIYLVELSSLSFIMCLFIYALLLEPFSSALLFIGTSYALFQLFVYCWMGTRVTNRIEELTAEIYEVNWYLMKPSQQKDVQLILLMAQNMKGFNGVFKELNMETFKNVLQFTHTLVTFLQSVK